MMKIFVIVIAAILITPSLRAQQSNSEKSVSRPAQQESASPPVRQQESPDSIKPGHPLEPADVDILTGKRDREIEESRRYPSVYLDGYGGYSSGFATNSRLRSGFGELPFLPLRRFGSPFFFSSIVPRNFGGRGWRAGR